VAAPAAAVSSGSQQQRQLAVVIEVAKRMAGRTSERMATAKAGGSAAV